MATMSSDSSLSPDQPPETTTPAPDSVAPPESAVKYTRAASLWSSLTAGFLILIVLLIFITQNTSTAQLAFLGWRGSLPLGVAILLAAVAGGLITVAGHISNAVAGLKYRVLRKPHGAPRSSSERTPLRQSRCGRAPRDRSRRARPLRGAQYQRCGSGRERHRDEAHHGALRT